MTPDRAIIALDRIRAVCDAAGISTQEQNAGGLWLTAGLLGRVGESATGFVRAEILRAAVTMDKLLAQINDPPPPKPPEPEAWPTSAVVNVQQTVMEFRSRK